MAFISGTEGPDTLLGTAAQDDIRGLGGNDYIDGLTGNDWVVGGPGNDIIAMRFGYGHMGSESAEGSEDVVRVYAWLDDIAAIRDGFLAFGPGAPMDVSAWRDFYLVDGTNLHEVRNFFRALNNVQADDTGVLHIIEGGGSFPVTGTAAGEVIPGGDAGVRLDGAGGNDVIYGNGGADTLVGGDGDDYLSAGLEDGSNDVFDGGAGINTISYSGTGGGVTIDLGRYYAQGAAVGNDQVFNTQVAVGGVGNDVLIGHDGPANTLRGYWGNDYLYGLGGNDALFGGYGEDVLIGEGGDDALYGDAGRDYLYAGTGANLLAGGDDVDVLVSEGAGDTLDGGNGDDYLYVYGTALTIASGGAGNDIFVMQSGPGSAFGGDGQDYFYMGASSDTMLGGAGVDVLIGGGGNDVFEGGAGTDYLFLGNGNDLATWRAGDGVDVIDGFQAGGTQDGILLVGSGFTSIAQVLAAATDHGSHCIVQIDPDSAIWLLGVSRSQLTVADFALQ